MDIFLGIVLSVVLFLQLLFFSCFFSVAFFQVNSGAFIGFFFSVYDKCNNY